MNVKRIIRRVTDNDYLFTIFTKILAVLIGLVASFSVSYTHLTLPTTSRV